MEIKRDFIFDPSLVLYLPLYRLAGNSVLSQDAYGHLCTVTGAVWRPYGREFDGTDDLISKTTDAFLLDEVTVELWTKPTTQVNPSSVGIWGYGTGITDRVNLMVSGGDLVLYDDINDAGSSTTLISPLPLDVWYHMVFISDSNGKSVYVDTVEKLAPDGTSTVFTDLGAGCKLFLGATMSTGGNPGAYYTGYIGEFRIYNRTLSHVEIQHNYEATKWRYK